MDPALLQAINDLERSLRREERLRTALERARADLLDLAQSDQHLAPAIERIDAALAASSWGPDHEARMHLA